MNLELVEHDRLGELAATVNDEYALMTGDMTRAVKRAIRIGELLTEAKAEVAHGEWIPWIEKNLAFGRIQAAKYMRISANVHSDVHLLDQARTIDQAVSLLSVPRDEPEDVQPSSAHAEPDPSDIAPVLDDDPDTEPEYRNDPALERDLSDAKAAAKRASEKVAAANRAIAEKELELAKLRKLKADKDRVETALRDLHELEKRKTELFKDAESTKLVHQTLARSREFFTRECMQIAALKLRPESVKVMRQDFEGLIELVENWLEAMKGRFL